MPQARPIRVPRFSLRPHRAGRALTALALCLPVLASSPPERSHAAGAGNADETPVAPAGLADGVGQGALRVARDDGTVVECPLRHTDVKADVSGFVARVRVTQTFENPYDEPIEAVYVFPLPPGAAVDEMTMVVGERRVVGVVKRRAEARASYEAAVASGYTASLLEQERPNVFTQTVGNVRPRQPVRIEIGYVDVLPYDGGSYEFHFPMVVGPRYVPGAAVSETPTVPGEPREPQGTGWSPDTDRVPDASRITPPVLAPGYRTGHDVALSVRIDAGVPIRDLRVRAHQARVERPGAPRAVVALSPQDSIPNKDFVLTYRVAGTKPDLAVLAHARPGEGGYFLLMMQPREIDEELRAAPPRDVCFLIDVSGSMSGAPTEAVREALRRLFERVRPEDRIQVVTFAGNANPLFASYLPASPANLARARSFTDSVQAGGGTEMLAGIRAVLADPVDPERVRIVVMLTDGYIGNEDEIIAEVGRRAGDQLRFWTIGIGSSPNRHLIDGVARQGGGMSAVLGLREDPSELVGRIVERIQRAQLSRIEIDWGGLDVHETYPARVPELWAGRPVVLFGRYRAGGRATVRLAGTAEGQPTSFPVELALPEDRAGHAVLAKVWARKKIEDLSDQLAVAVGDPEPLEEEVTTLALHHRLISAYTSFVAVDEYGGAAEGPPRPPHRMLVPLPLPEGLSFEGIFGEERDEGRAVGEMVMLAAPAKHSRVARRAGRSGAAPVAPPPPAPGTVAYASPSDAGVAGGVIGGLPGGVVAATVGGVPMASTMPAPPGPQAPMRRLLEVPDRPIHGRSPIPARDLSERHAEAREALEQARRHAGARRWDAARRQLQLAHVLEEVYLRAQAWGEDGTRAGIAELWNAAEEARTEEALLALPALERRLDLVVRNTDLETALRSVATAAGVHVHIEAGSLEDAAAMRDVDRLRVSYRDLRRADVAQALTWLLQPAGLEWHVEAGAVQVRSSRRAGETTAWVYHAGDLARPPAGAPSTDDAATQALRDLERVVSAALPAARDGARAAMLDGNLLLVVGDREAHEAAAALLGRIRGSGADPGFAAGRSLSPAQREAWKAVRARGVANHEEQVRRSRLARIRRSARVLDRASWELLAAAYRREASDEAVAELHAVWEDLDQTGDVGSVAPALVARALWTIGEARAALPPDAGLEGLREAASRASHGWAETLLERIRQSPDDAGLHAAAVYAGLLTSRDNLARDPHLDPGLARTLPQDLRGPMAAVADLLLGLGHGRSATLVHDALESGHLSGDDAVLLGALALHRAGMREWNAFRDRRVDLARTGRVSASALRALGLLDGVRPARGMAETDG